MSKDTRTRLFATLGIIVIIAAVGLFIYRSVIGFGESQFFSQFTREVRREQTAASTQVSSGSYDLSGFDSIEVDGAWELKISEGDFSVDVSSSEAVRDDLRVRVDGQTLRLGLRNGTRSINPNLEATIVLPDLEELDIDGSADVRFSGFDLEELELDVDGAATIRGVDSTIEQLHVDVDGAANIDLDEASVVNADVQMDGAGKLDIRMAGGTLEGEVNGVGTVTWFGDVSSESIDIDGIGTVRQR